MIPTTQRFRGSLALHTGAAKQARRLARRDLAMFPDDVDAIVTNAAGCGSGMKKYELLFEGEPENARATAIARKVTDVSSLLDELGIVEIPPPAPRSQSLPSTPVIWHARRTSAARRVACWRRLPASRS